MRYLGGGGMGEVYEAEHLASGRLLALKLIGSRYVSDESGRQRFLREGRLAASLNHPNTVYIYGTEEIEGIPVITMELVRGPNLQKRVDVGGALSISEAVGAILQVIAGLEAAHALGILHRDVKPLNCFVDGDGRVKVGDFGLAFSSFESSKSRQTGTGQSPGYTHGFAPPEQIDGDELDAHSDIFSVGVTLYYLSTGALPFSSYKEVRARGIKFPEQVRRTLPQGLAKVILRCLDPQPSKRYKNCARLRHALLPFRLAAPTYAALGPRLLAGLVDFALFYAAFLTVSFFLPKPTGHFEAFLVDILTAHVLLALYYVPEIFWAASPGKTLAELEVIAFHGSKAGRLRMLVRTLIFAPVIALTAWLTTEGMQFHPMAPSGWLGPLGAAIGTLIPLLCPMLPCVLFATARRENGFLGVHDLLTSTRVVAKSDFDVRPSPPLRSSLQTKLPVSPETAPRIGPYCILSASDRRGDKEMLLAWDPSLRRSVWIRKLGEGGSPVSSTTRDVARSTRLRWLNGRRSAEGCWDAYDAPRGLPLLALLGSRQPWNQVRWWVMDLADELEAASKDDSLPATLALDRIWIADDDRAKLLDFSVREVPGISTGEPCPSDSSCDPIPVERNVLPAFLKQVAMSALEGRPATLEEAIKRPVAAPLPPQARAVLNDLSNVSNPGELRQQINSLVRERPAVSGSRHFWAQTASILLVFAAMAVYLFNDAKSLLRTRPELAELDYFLERLECIPNTATPPDRVQHVGRANSGTFAPALDPLEGTNAELGVKLRNPAWLESFIIGRFANTLLDLDKWEGFGDVEDIMTSARYKRAVELLKGRSTLREEEIRDAAKSFKPQLDRMQPEMQKALLRRSMPRFLILNAFFTSLAFASLSAAAALLFRRGMLLRLVQIEMVTRAGERGSRPRLLFRSLIAWSPVLLALPISWAALEKPVWSRVLLPLFIAAGTWSLLVPTRSLPNLVAKTFFVPAAPLNGRASGLGERALRAWKVLNSAAYFVVGAAFILAVLYTGYMLHDAAMGDKADEAFRRLQAGDIVGAGKLYRRLAEQGYAEAQNTLGRMYADGEGVDKDPGEAIRWFRKAADQGNGLADYNLALMYDRGEGVARDIFEAAKWVRKAWKDGNVRALQQYAWILATSSEARQRDGRTAVRIAERAVVASSRKEHYLLDTLAAAYAETGRFQEAVSVEKEAIAGLHRAPQSEEAMNPGVRVQKEGTAISDDGETEKEYTGRLKLYESHQPYRDAETLK